MGKREKKVFFFCKANEHYGYSTYQGEKICMAILQTGAVSLVVLMRHCCSKHIFMSQHISLKP